MTQEEINNLKVGDTVYQCIGQRTDKKAWIVKRVYFHLCSIHLEESSNSTYLYDPSTYTKTLNIQKLLYSDWSIKKTMIVDLI